MTRSMLLVSILLLAVAAQAGPPLVCHPFEIGTAKSLPWREGNDWNSPRNDYDRARLIGDTLALLNPDTPVIVRMETLRRAAIYASKEPQIAADLLARLMSRAQEAEGKGKPDALAFFDAGYLAETFKQMDYLFKVGNPATGSDGYALVKKALSLRGKVRRGDHHLERPARRPPGAHREGHGHGSRGIPARPKPGQPPLASVFIRGSRALLSCEDAKTYLSVTWPSFASSGRDPSPGLLVARRHRRQDGGNGKSPWLFHLLLGRQKRQDLAGDRQVG